MDGSAASTTVRGATAPRPAAVASPPRTGSPVRRSLQKVHTAWSTASPSARWFSGLLVAYVLLTVAVMLRTPLLDVDAWVRHLRLRGHHPQWYPYVHDYVILGQRGPTTLIALPWFFWIAHRRRSVQPLVMLGVALAVLNVSVAIVKYSTGRLTPRDLGTPADALFQGGNIYPSGHISNCVVLYGLIALIAAPQYRRLLTVIAIVISITVSMGTVFINTHWVTDVIGGALAGGLVLCSLPWLVPPTERWWLRRVASWRSRRTARAAGADADLLDGVPGLDAPAAADLDSDLDSDLVGASTPDRSGQLAS